MQMRRPEAAAAPTSLSLSLSLPVSFPPPKLSKTFYFEKEKAGLAMANNNNNNNDDDNKKNFVVENAHPTIFCRFFIETGFDPNPPKKKPNVIPSNYGRPDWCRFDLHRTPDTATAGPNFRLEFRWCII